MSVRACAAAALAGLGLACGAERRHAESPEMRAVAVDDGWREAESAAGTWRVRWRCEPAAPASGATARILVEAVRADGLAPDELRADAGMPEHGHGLLRRPSVAAQGGGRFAVGNVYLHMPGAWRVYLDLGREGIFERLEIALDVD